jgi:hypothetical protein
MLLFLASKDRTFRNYNKKSNFTLLPIYFDLEINQTRACAKEGVGDYYLQKISSVKRGSKREPPVEDFLKATQLNPSHCILTTNFNQQIE